MLCINDRFGNLVLISYNNNDISLWLRSCFLVFRIEVDELEKDQLTGHRTLLDELSNWNPLFSSIQRLRQRLRVNWSVSISLFIS